MKKSIAVCLLAAAVIAPAAARNTTYMLPWDDVLNSPEAKQQLDNNIRFAFGDDTVPAGAERVGELIVNKIARGTGEDRKDDSAACRNAALQALVELQQRARNAGADAVLNVVSYYKSNVFVSATQFECHAGGTGGHLTFKAVLVKHKK